MAQRKLQQEIDKCFKRVAEGVQAFEATFEKIQQASNASQKEKLEDALKREIKKLQRQRDQIKTWAASNEIKDKKPLLEQRKLIETQMEKFKAVEKEMKTKAYSKEGLSAAAKLDPKEKEKLEACQFLSSMVEELERQIETLEAEAESLQANLKKGKKDTQKAERVAEIERLTERHKWHQAKLELILRSLENGGLETEQVVDLQENIKYYVESNQEADFMEDDAIYDELHLQEEEDMYGMGGDVDRVSSQDAQSIQDDTQDGEAKASVGAGKAKATEPSGAAARRPSTQMRSPLPALATLHAPLANATNGVSNSHMKPALPPSRPAGETLKYASAAAAAAAGDKGGVGIAPLPPPPGAAPPAPSGPPGLSPLPPPGAPRTSATTSPRTENAQPAEAQPKGPPASVPQPPAPKAAAVPSNTNAKQEKPENTRPGPAKNAPPKSMETKSAVPESHEPPSQEQRPEADSGRSRSSSHVLPTTAPATITPSNNNNLQLNGKSVAPVDTGNSTSKVPEEEDAPESIYHLPPGLQDLLQSFEVTKSRIAQNASPSAATTNPTTRRLLAASHETRPDSIHADRPRPYKPERKFNSPTYYPQEPLPLFEDPRLFARADTDTLFYTFYYRQGTFQQYLAAKALKSQSWRFHKQYQTWFQRHEEPKTITEEYEQGTYRFFDYESTWMNRRKADFRFAYRFLEDDL